MLKSYAATPKADMVRRTSRAPNLLSDNRREDWPITRENKVTRPGRKRQAANEATDALPNFDSLANANSTSDRQMRSRFLTDESTSDAIAFVIVDDHGPANYVVVVVNANSKLRLFLSLAVVWRRTPIHFLCCVD